jgi:signal transduction histidine kinase/ABC-type amino acid transport substrate-binding protein
MLPRANRGGAPGRNGRRSRGFYWRDSERFFSTLTNWRDGSGCCGAALSLALLILALVSPGAVGQTPVATPRTIRVVTDNVYAPYSFESDEGKLQGIVIDQWRAWEKKTGIKVEIYAMDWGEAVQRMRAGEFDVIDSIVETAERREYFDFTPTYAAIDVPIFFRNDISGISDLASLKGFPVGVKTGDQHIERLKANGVTTVISFPNYNAIIEAAKQHKINVFVADDPSALYLLNKAGIEDEFRHSAPMFHDELRRAVRKGDTALLRTVSEGFAAIDPAELKRIDEKWFGQTINRIGRYLITYVGYAAALAVLLVAGLAGWNRTLRKRILQRTAALSESEQRFRRLVELMPVAVYVCDTSGIIQIYNHRAVELWGREPKPGDTAQRYCASLRLYSPGGKVVPHEESKMAEVLRTGVPSHDVEVVIERPDGSHITALVNIAPLRNGKGELLGAMNCFQDITERKRAEKDLEDAHRKLKILSQRRVKVQEEERRHLARELHDEVGQALTAAKINLQAAMKESDGARSKRIDETTAILEKLLGQVRQISIDLRPSTLDDLGLIPALRSLLDQQGRRASVAVHLSAKDVPENLDPEIKTTCFRIAQEAITNAVRHANATRIDVDLSCENGNLRLHVRDDGKGFDAESSQEQTVGLGLIGIKERAALVGGRAKIVSSPSKGTTIETLLPLTPCGERASRGRTR